MRRRVNVSECEVELARLLAAWEKRGKDRRGERRENKGEKERRGEKERSGEKERRGEEVGDGGLILGRVAVGMRSGSGEGGREGGRLPYLAVAGASLQPGH